MPKPKFCRVQLSRMLREGKGVCQIAEHFGVSPGAVSRAKKELHLGVIRNVGLENAHRVVSENLDAVAELKRINREVHKILDGLTDSEAPADKVLLLKCSAEIRQQIELQANLFRMLCDVEAVAEFQREVLEAISEVSPEMRGRILMRLKEKRALRASVRITTGGEERYA